MAGQWRDTADGSSLAKLGLKLGRHAAPPQAPAAEIEIALAAALEHHRAGRLAEAEPLYRNALALAPGNLDVIYNLGVLAHQAGRDGEAAELLTRAVALNDRIPALHVSLGAVRQAQGRLDEAEAAYGRAIAIAPGFADAHNNLGNLLQRQGRLDEAVGAYRRAVALRPAYPEARYNLGLALAALERLDEAAAAYRGAIAQAPGHAGAHNNLGDVLRRMGRPDEAAAACERAVALSPRDAGALANLAQARLDQDRPEAAAEALARALALDPGHAGAHHAMGNALQALGRPEAALEAYDRALALQPGLAEAQTARGNALTGLKRMNEAFAAHDRAMALDPALAEARLNKAQALLLTGRYEEGWRLYEARKTVRAPRGNRAFDAPAWLGETPVAGKTLLVHWEQGLGDTLQFCRYVPLLARAGARVLFAPQPPLRALMRSLGPGVELVDLDRPLPAFDLHCPLLSLPLAFRTDAGAIPAAVPYLAAEPGRVDRWRARIGGTGFRVGVCWRGGVRTAHDGRAVPLAAFAGLARLPGVRLISLQKGDDGPGERPDGMALERLGEDFDAGPDAFLDSAAAMQALDLVISADTAVLHLAGALGVPVWAALKFSPDWRWPLDRPDSPWYPSLRRFHQGAPGDWPSAFAAMEAALRGQPRSVG